MREAPMKSHHCKDVRCQGNHGKIVNNKQAVELEWLVAGHQTWALGNCQQVETNDSSKTLWTPHQGEVTHAGICG